MEFGQKMKSLYFKTKFREVQMKIKNIIDVLSIGVIIGFIAGFLNSLDPITANRYIQYKMFRLVAINLQEFLNTNVFLFLIISMILYLYILWFLFVNKIRFDKNKAAQFGRIIIIVTIAILFIGFFKKFLAKSFIFLLIKNFPGRIIELMTGKLSFSDFSNLFKTHIWETIFLAISAIVIALLYRLVRKLKWEKILTIIKARLIIIKIKHARRTAFVLVVFLLILNLAIVVGKRINLPKGPNVILIVVDTLRADHLSCYGYSRKTSPNIDNLSLDSVLFKNAISPAPWTAPSIGSLLTSQYPSVLGFKDDAVKINDKFLTLAEIFKENYYKTKGIISHEYVSHKVGFNQGFDSYDEDNSRGEYDISSPSITEKAISFIKEHHKNHKFFLFLHYFDPHCNFNMHPNYNYYPNYSGTLTSGQTQVELLEKAPSMSADDIKYIKALYDSEISFTDEYIGKFLNKLKELGLYNNTLIIFTADHGEEFLERGDYWIGHCKTLYQELIHVPLIIKLPGKNKKKIIDKYIGLIDLMPTIIDYAGLRIPNEYEGEIVNINDEKELKSKIIISETKKKANLQSVIWRPWKFIYDPNGNLEQLFNLKKDPNESKNVALKDERILKEMETILQNWNDYVKLNKSEAKAQIPNFTEEQKKRLKSLGYIK